MSAARRWRSTRDRTGLIVANDGDTGKLANAMVEGAGSGRYRAMRAAAQERMSDFSMEKMIDKTEAVYRRLAAGA